MITVVTLYILFTIRVNLRAMSHFADHNNQILNLYLRILTDYFQILSALFRINIHLSFGINSLFDKFSMFTDFIGNFFVFFYPLDCLYQRFATNYNTNVFYLGLYLLICIYPLIYIIHQMFWVIFAISAKISFSKIKEKSFLSLFLVSYMLQPSFINAYLKYINCKKIGNVLFVKSYLKEKCWEGFHLFHFLAFVFPALLLWMIFYPSYVFVLLRKHHKKKIMSSSMKDKINSFTRFSFFTDGLKPEFYFWELFLMIRKYSFLILSVFPLSNSTMVFNLCLMNIVSVFTLILQINYRPFAVENSLKMSILSNGGILFCVFSFFVLSIDNSAFYQLTIVFLLVLYNIILAGRWLYDVYMLKKQELSLKVELWKSSLRKMFKSKKLNQKILPSSNRVFIN